MGSKLRDCVSAMTFSIDPTTERLARGWWIAFVAFCFLSVLPLWICTYPPMIDLPQHVGEMSVALNWNDARFGYQETYYFNWRVSQIVTHVVTLGFAQLIPLMVAVKIVLSLAVIALPLATWGLIRQVGGSPWWVLLVFPFSYGFATCWGFYNYIFATPLAVALLSLCLQVARSPTAKGLFAVALFAHVLFLTHILALAYASCVGAALLVVYRKSWRSCALQIVALASPLPAVLFWRSVTESSSYDLPPVWNYGLHRLGELIQFQLANYPQQETTWTAALLLSAPFLLGARLSPNWRQWIPLALTVCIFGAAPETVADTAFLYGRFAIFLFPALLFALRRGEPVSVARSGVICSASAVALSLLSLRYWAFEGEQKGFGELLSTLEPQKRILYLPTWSQSAYVPGPVYLHWGCYYQLEKGGVADFSFAEFFPSYFRYRTLPGLPPGIEWTPGLFRYVKHGGEQYDYLLTRGPVLQEWFDGVGMQNFGMVEVPGGWSAVRREMPEAGSALGVK